jgi:hypothetical protein
MGPQVIILPFQPNMMKTKENAASLRYRRPVRNLWRPMWNGCWVILLLISPTAPETERSNYIFTLLHVLKITNPLAQSYSRGYRSYRTLYFQCRHTNEIKITNSPHTGLQAYCRYVTSVKAAIKIIYTYLLVWIYVSQHSLILQAT